MVAKRRLFSKREPDVLIDRPTVLLVVSALGFLTVFMLAVLPGRAAHGQSAIAIVETVGDLDLSAGGDVLGRVSRVGSQDAQGAVGMFLHGTVQLVPGSSGATGRVTWQSLASGQSGGDTAAVPGLGSTLATSNASTIVPVGSRLQVTGDLQSLIRAANQLAATDDSDGDETAEEDSSTGTRDSASLDTSTVGGGSSDSENDLANPETLDVASTPTTTTEVVATDAYGTTTDGCEPLLDEDQNVVIIMEAPTKNGTVTGPCVESLTTVPVKTSFVGCEYREDEAGGLAYAQHREYYTYGASTTFLDDECVDSEETFVITERIGQCPIVPDLANNLAVQETELVFIGRQNEPNIVGECAAREGATFPIVFDVSACSMRDDFAQNVTWLRHRPMYEGPDRRLHAVGECVDSTTFYVHERDYSVCEVFADYAEDKLYQQYRIKIPVAGPDQFRTAVCTPDTNAIANLEETGVGCEANRNDYDGYSMGFKRIIRTDTQGEVRGCQEADVRYEHQFEAQGWLYDDANLQASPSEVPFINLPAPAGKTYIGAAVVRAGVQPTTYVQLRSFERDTDIEYLPGSCDSFQNRDLIEVYQRPDGTEYEHNAGAATPAAGYACSVVGQATWSVIPSTASAYTQTWTIPPTCTGVGREIECSGGGTGSLRHCSGTFRGSRTLRRTDGLTITEESGNTYGLALTGSSCTGSGNTIPPIWSGVEVGQWTAGEGW